ncbi:hypothetical protein D1007_59463 [Hordeum vulgare]|nr:hypothetical protein D1007_59463 [Hordeum vulgare]
MESDSEETRAWIANHSLQHAEMLAKLGDEMPMTRATTSPRARREAATTSQRLEGRALLDALCRHREILRRETDFLRGEVNSRGLSTLARKKAYRETQSNGRTMSPSLVSDSLGPRAFQLVGVSLPHLVAAHQESLDLLLRESDHLRYRILSLASMLRESGIPGPSPPTRPRCCCFACRARL